jgi:hypothetical protein
MRMFNESLHPTNNNLSECRRNWRKQASVLIDVLKSSTVLHSAFRNNPSLRALIKSHKNINMQLGQAS